MFLIQDVTRFVLATALSWVVVNNGIASEQAELPAGNLVSEADAAQGQGAPDQRASLIQRLSPAFLKQFDADRQELAKHIESVRVPYDLVRSTLHFHSHFSHDSIGTLEEIVRAAKATGTQIICFTEHPSRSVDVVAENVKGWHEGVYFLAGTESKNELHWPARENESELRFVCHPEEVPEFDLTIYDGIEIYNTHSDVKEEPQAVLLSSMLLNLTSVKQHPEAAFCSFLDYPQDFLTRFDRLTSTTRFAGIAGNDSHQNQRLKITASSDGTVEAYDGTDDKVWSAEGFKAKLVMAALGQQKQPAEKKVLAEVQLDPYEISMRHVGTFLQLKNNQPINEFSVREAVRNGRAILGFEIIAPLPSVGFWIEQDGSPIGTVGDEISWSENLSLQVRLPLSAEVRIIRNGKVFKESQDKQLEIESLPAGVYRLEAFQQLAGQRYPWVLSNPIYLTKSD